MEMTQLRTFVAVAEEAHLTRAAERLFTSQPAVSAQLKSLEEELGVTLFDRTPKGMLLTPAGKSLLEKARHILESTREMMGTAQQLKGEVHGELKVGINSDPEFLHLPELITSCREHMPNVALHLINSMSAEILLDIRKGKLDSGYFFGPCPTSDLYTVRLEQTPLALIAPTAWADRFENASVPELAVMRWVYTTERCPFYQITRELFADHRFNPEQVVFVDSEDTIRTLVKAESGIALLRESDALRAEAEGWGCRWKGELPGIDLNLAIARRRVQEPLMQAWLARHEVLWPDLQAPLADQSGSRSA